MVLEAQAFNTIKVLSRTKEISKIGDLYIDLLVDVNEFLAVSEQNNRTDYDDCYLLIECEFKSHNDDKVSPLYQSRILFPFGGVESYNIFDILFYFDLELESEIIDELFYQKNIELVKILSPSLSILSFDDTMYNFKNIIRYLIYYANPFIENKKLDMDILYFSNLPNRESRQGKALLASWVISKDNIGIDIFLKN